MLWLQVYKHYRANTITESVDPILKDEYPEREASNVLQIRLLCTQAPLAVRPSMSEVVYMLTDKECSIPSPKQPPFLNASILNSDVSRTSMNSLLRKKEGESLKSPIQLARNQNVLKQLKHLNQGS